MQNNYITKFNITNKKRVCVINLANRQNVGTALVKYSMYKFLENLGFNATIVASKSDPQVDISFLKRTVKSNLIVIKQSFYELNENDYDYIFVSSDQTWAYFDKKYFYDIAFLKFAENWKIPKFIYAASIGMNNWFNNTKDKEIALKLLKNFTGISFREKYLLKLTEDYLGIKGEYVIDPTLLLDKEYYLNDIKNYTTNFSSNEKFIFVYQLDKNEEIANFIKESSKRFNYKINKHILLNNDYIESFIFGINNSQAVITDSFHGTIFSILFNKPFISFINRNRGKGRFETLKEVFNIQNRIIDPLNMSDMSNININLLLEPPNVNKSLFNDLKNFSINYLKKNLGLSKF